MKMVKGRSIGTVQETILQNELNRIRETYSFRLGLLLTEAFVRRPWKIPLLPFLFLKMNIDFIRSAKHRRGSFEGSTFGFDENCLLIMTTSEGGVSATERAISIAKSWITNPQRRIVVVSTNEHLNSMKISGVSLYHIPDPKAHREISTSEWNETCANVVRGAIETHRPIAFIFQGTYPYRGVLNAIGISPGLNSTWLRPENINLKLVQKGEGVFTRILSFEELTEEEDATISTITSAERTTAASNLVLVGTGYGQHHQRDRLPKQLNRALIQNTLHRFVFPKNADTGNLSRVKFDHWDTIIGHSEFNSLCAAITRDDLHLVKALRRQGVPTLCLIDNQTGLATLRKLQRIAEAGGLFITNIEDNAEFNLYHHALLDQAWNDSIRSNRSIGPTDDWGRLIEKCLAREV